MRSEAKLKLPIGTRTGMASNFLWLLLLSSIAVVALASDFVSADFCPISSYLGCASRASVGQANCTPPMLMAADSAKRRSGGRQNARSTTPKGATGGASSSSGGGQQGAAQTTAAGGQSGTSGQDTSQNIACKVGQQFRDWFTAIKKPNSHEYAYLSSKNPVNWKYAGNITSQGPVFDTLSQARQNGVSTVAYSDKPPPNENYNTTYGHLKGLFMVGQQSGFWMMYSARHFPRWNPAGNILEQDRSNAQSFICISVTTAKLENIMDWLAPSMPRYQPERPLVQQPGPISVNHFDSKGGNSFKIFLKPKNSDAECIYRHIRGHYTNSNGFRVQSWLFNRNGILPEQNEVTHVKNVTMAVQGQEQPWQWNTSVDHSKWCVSNSGQTVCLADLNRVTGHLTQGGAAVCFENPSVWKAFDGLLKVP